MSQFDPSGHLEQVVWLFLGSPHYYTPATDTVAPLAFLLPGLLHLFVHLFLMHNLTVCSLDLHKA